MAQKRVNKVLIGKDIARTEELQITDPSTTATYIADGEVIVLDKDKNLLSTGDTITDTDTIYIAVGTSDTYDYTLPDGTLVENAKKLDISGPIKANNVVSYKGLNADSAATERQATIDIATATSFTPVVGTEYVIRIVYKDINEHPGQFIQDFRAVAESATPGDLTDAFVSKINKNKDSRISAENSTDDLVLTGKVIPNSSADAIDEYQQVDFDVALHEVEEGDWDDVSVTYDTNAHPGNGNPKLVRDREKHALAYEGVTNMTQFPVIKPDMKVDMSTWYDAIVIESNVPYVSTSVEYGETSPQTVELYLPDGAAQTSTDPTLGHDAVTVALNTWMESTGFGNISFS